MSTWSWPDIDMMYWCQALIIVISFLVRTTGDHAQQTCAFQGA